MFKTTPKLLLGLVGTCLALIAIYAVSKPRFLFRLLFVGIIAFDACRGRKISGMVLGTIFILGAVVNLLGFLLGPSEFSFEMIILLVSAVAYGMTAAYIFASKDVRNFYATAAKGSARGDSSSA